MAIDWLGICHPSDFADIALCAPGRTTRSKLREQSALAPSHVFGGWLAAAGAARQSAAASAATSGGAILMPRNVAASAAGGSAGAQRDRVELDPLVARQR